MRRFKISVYSFDILTVRLFCHQFSKNVIYYGENYRDVNGGRRKATFKRFNS